MIGIFFMSIKVQCTFGKGALLAHTQKNILGRGNATVRDATTRLMDSHFHNQDISTVHVHVGLF